MRLLSGNEWIGLLRDPFLSSTCARVHRSSCAAVERREFLFRTEKLDLDLSFLMAVDRFTTGANVHKIRGLAHAYVLACENNQASKAEEYLSRLLGELGRSAKTSKP
jgi:hypothetical protein